MYEYSEYNDYLASELCLAAMNFQLRINGYCNNTSMSLSEHLRPAVSCKW
jgi:hypothetical protein